MNMQKLHDTMAGFKALLLDIQGAKPSLMRPCPKCGHAVVVNYVCTDTHECARVECPKCGKKSRKAPNPGLAIERHNRT